MPEQHDVEEIEDDDLHSPGEDPKIRAPKFRAEAAKSKAYLAEVDA